LPDHLVLRLPKGEPITAAFEGLVPTLQRDAMYWSYALRNRQRWAGADLDAKSPINRLLNDAQLRQIAEQLLVEIEIPFAAEEIGWELRVMPWEHLLSRATKRYRGEKRLTVIRWLRKSGNVAMRRNILDRVLVVESAPAGLDRFYDVKAEGELVIASLGGTPASVPIVENPSQDELRAALKARQPSLVHLAAVDTHEAREVLGLNRRLTPDDETRFDGVALRGVDPRPDFVGASQLAAALALAPAKPELVVCNFFNSAARTASLIVSEGARSAIGYQDFIDASLAASFCTTLYRETREGTGLLGAFRRGLETLRKGPKGLEGACIVLWSSESLISETQTRTRARRPQAAAMRATKPPSEVTAGKRIRVFPEPLQSINYSLLHNRRSLFKSLQITRGDVTGAIDGIQIEVTLFVGEENFPFRLTLSLPEGENFVDVAERVVVPLTSSIIRTQGESMQSSLFLQVKCDDVVVHADTTRVQLQPVDEWTDTDDDRWWLPSFVLPRDPAVARIIDHGQRYLMAMADDPGAGFDGYQSVDETAPSLDAKYGPVDLQVRAIWSALLYDHQLRYINPPPSYAVSRQRLRTPSDVIHGNRGTCIDLALLLAACLEYVDIYPVLFLLKEHAFPGYWRSPGCHDEFHRMKNLPLPDTASPDALRASERTTVHFEDAYSLKNFYEARDFISKGYLIPLETVWLTNAGSFADAVEEGRKNLRRAGEFDSMLDIALARHQRQVTPLPIIGRPE
jgi:hypothetical protein